MGGKEEKNGMHGLEIDATNGSEKNNKEKFAAFEFFKKFQKRIHKPSLPVKLGYFLWMTAASSGMVYFYVYLKLQGVTITDLFWINTITSVATVIELPVLAAILDKIGKSPKLALVINLLLLCVFLIFLLLIPPIPSCEAGVHYNCLNDTSYFLGKHANCEAAGTEIRRSFCELRCIESLDKVCQDETKCDIVHDFLKNSPYTNGSYPSCYDNKTVQSFATISESLCDEVSNDSCSVTCTMVDSDDCKKRKSLLIPLYIIVTCAFMVTYSNVYRFLEVTVVALMKEHNFSYGVVRFWAVCGSLLGPSLSGFVVNMATPVGEPANYRAGFYLQIALLLFTTAISCKIDVRPLDPGTDLTKKAWSLIRIPNILIFMFVLLILGTTWAFNIMFKTWYLNDIGASSNVLSVVNAMSALYGLPFLYISDWVLNKVGNSRMIVLALLAHAVHSFSYSAIDNAWYAVAVELTSIFTYHFMWVSVISFTRKITPEGLLATINSTAGALHFNCGRITGSFFGGFLMKTYGGKFTYNVIGITNSVVSVLYILYLYLRKRTYSK